MDPNALLTEALTLASRIMASGDRFAPNARPEDAQRLAELVAALDGWMIGGGFLPSRWTLLRQQRAR